MSENNPNHTAGYETSDINATKVVAVGMVVVIVVVLFLVILNEYFIQVREDLVQQQVLSKESALLRDIRAREAEILNSYGVLDRQAGVYRIPIERAMEVYADEAFRQVQSGRAR
jgi:hypothetical protein